MNRTNDISNLFNRFGANADSYYEFDSYFEYKEKPLALVSTAPDIGLVKAHQGVVEATDTAPSVCAIHDGGELSAFDISHVAAPLRHLLAEVTLARQEEARARDEEALRQALAKGRPGRTKAHVVALISAEDGVGKSTLVSALARQLRVERGRTLAIDLDPQNATQHYPRAEPDVAGMGGASLRGENWSSLLLAGPTDSLLLPYGAIAEDERLALESYLKNDRFWLARKMLSMDLGENDVVILDTPRGRSDYLDQALMVADQVLVIITAQSACSLALDQLQHLLIERKARGLAPHSYYVINRFDAFGEFCQKMHEVLKSRLGADLLGTVALDCSVEGALAYDAIPLLDSDSSPFYRDMRGLSDMLKAQLQSMDFAESYAS